MSQLEREAILFEREEARQKVREHWELQQRLRKSKGPVAPSSKKTKPPSRASILRSRSVKEVEEGEESISEDEFQVSKPSKPHEKVGDVHVSLGVEVFDLTTWTLPHCLPRLTCCFTMFGVVPRGNHL